MNSQSGVMKRYENDPADAASIGANFTTGLCKGKSGNLWIGTWSNSGLNRLDLKTKKFKHYLVGNIIRSIYKDVSGKIWIGTNSGMYYRDDVRDSFIAVNAFGEEFMTAAIQVEAEDDDRNIWGTSSLGIFRLNTERRELCIYGERFGINDHPDNSYRHFSRLADGKLIFSKDSGYYSFLPRDVINSMPSQIILVDLKVNGQSPNFKKGSSFKGAIEETKKIELAYNQNNFSIDFAAIHYSSPEDNTLYYMLEGYDNGWLRADSLKTVRYNRIPPGKYTFKIKASSSYGVWSEKEIKIVITPPWWVTWWFITSAVILLVSSFYLAIRWWLHRKFRQQLDRTQKEKELVELKQKAGELEMLALRSQMNPHFIFNSLNSINMFILENNKLQASDYLSKFSKLMRLILQNSQEAFIPLERELDALRLYLELESLRFVNKFEYTIDIGDHLNTTVLKVPPLIIQPYVENAIWHGLMHKKEKGHLKIELSGEYPMLFYKIIDDGIGRKKSAELDHKTKSSTQRSMGMRITADRIAMLQQQNKTSITITDLVLANGNPGGTEVLIKLPVHYD
jgi:sensor histidine kinase YesM